MSTTPAEHWDSAYGRMGEAGGSWFQDDPSPSLGFLDGLGIATTAAVVDVGGGASRLVDRLLARGHEDVTVLDASEAALLLSKARLGDRAGRVAWLVEDVTSWVPSRSYDVWHDRALFHFLVEPSARARYRQALRRGLASRGTVIVATFAEDGPEQCSGLPVARYSPEALAPELGKELEVVAMEREVHTTPWGAAQPFSWVALRRR